MNYPQSLGDLAAPLRPICPALRRVLCLACVTFLAMVHQFGAAQDAEALMRGKGCMACHMSNGRLVGPGFDAIRARYGTSDLPYLVNRIRSGSSKVWGVIPMPANPEVSYSEAELMAAAILGTGGYAGRVSSGGSRSDDPPSTGGTANLR